MILSLRNQPRWPRLLKLQQHLNRLNLPKRLKHRSRQKWLKVAHPQFLRSRLCPLYQRFPVFLQCRQFRRCLLFRAETSAFVEHAPSSTT